MPFMSFRSGRTNRLVCIHLVATYTLMECATRQYVDCMRRDKEEKGKERKACACVRACVRVRVQGMRVTERSLTPFRAALNRTSPMKGVDIQGEAGVLAKKEDAVPWFGHGLEPNVARIEVDVERKALVGMANHARHRPREDRLSALGGLIQVE